MDLSTLPSVAATLAAVARTPDYVWAALASAVTTLALAQAFAPRRAARGRDSQAPAPGACDFLVHGGALQPLTDPARALVAGFPPGAPPLAALRAHLAGDCPGIDADLEGLILFGTGFRRHCQRSDGGAVEILGEPRGAATFLSVRPASEEARALRAAEAGLARAGDEARFLRAALDRAPVLAWSLGADGQVAWANAGYRDRFAAPAGELPDHRIPDVFGHVIEEVPLTSRAGGTRRRVAVPGPQDGEAHWFEVSETQGPSGERLGFALDADDLVASEASLRRFIETLTETFAHLPIGLAVFDKNRRLGLFNPALTDLVRIDAVWLAGRPSLRDFLERLRETRQMPEQKDFAAWRRKLGELEEGARDGTYEENWVLPSGKVFRVTGRPHPQGALAFLFEDISTAIQLERRYRSELELSQATLDRLAEAVAVFDASGSLVFVNSAFETLWGLEPMDGLEGPGVAAMAEIWAERCHESPAWAELAEYATAAEARGSWTAAIETRAGRRLEMAVSPLPDASSLVVFRDAAVPALAHDPLLDDLALEHIHLPVETAVRQVMAAIPAAQGAEAFQGLSAAAQALKDGLARSRELHALARRDAAAGPLPGLAAALAARGLALAAPVVASDWSPGQRRAALALVLAVADQAAEGVTVTLTAAPGSGGFALSAAADAAPGLATRAEPASLPLARRVVEAEAGRLEVTASGGRLELRAEFPAAVAVLTSVAPIARSA